MDAIYHVREGLSKNLVVKYQDLLNQFKIHFESLAHRRTRKPAPVIPRIPKHLISRLKASDVSADCLDGPRYVSAQFLLPRLWLYESEQKPVDKRCTVQELPISRIDGRSVNAYQEFIVLRRRFWNLF